MAGNFPSHKEILSICVCCPDLTPVGAASITCLLGVTLCTSAVNQQGSFFEKTIETFETRSTEPTTKQRAGEFVISALRLPIALRP